MEQQQNEETQLLPSTEHQSTRDHSIDNLRGLLMIWESVDHAREFISTMKIDHEQWYSLPNYEHPTLPKIALWLIRQPTSFCASGFMFLMGLGMCLFVSSRKSIGWGLWQILRHFIVRGSILILLNFISFPPLYVLLGMVPILTVLFALGFDMIIGGLVMELELILKQKLNRFLDMDLGHGFAVAFYSILSLGIVIFTTEFVNYLPLPSNTTVYPKWLLTLLLPYIPADMSFVSIYPILPWTAMVFWGILWGRLYQIPSITIKQKIQLHAITGILFILLFVILRTIGKFGNIHMELFKTPLDFISFMTLVKYPPSLTYVLWTLGVNHLLLVLFMVTKDHQFYKPLNVFGKSALFFYIVHFWVFYVFSWIQDVLHIQKFDLIAFIFTWVAGLVILYKMCTRYSQFKSSTDPDSLWRLF